VGTFYLGKGGRVPSCSLGGISGKAFWSGQILLPRCGKPDVFILPVERFSTRLFLLVGVRNIGGLQDSGGEGAVPVRTKLGIAAGGASLIGAKRLSTACWLMLLAGLTIASTIVFHTESAVFTICRLPLSCTESSHHDNCRCHPIRINCARYLQIPPLPP
jgi:hypothetical protein